MAVRLFDVRFDDACAESFRLSALRVLMAPVVALIIALCVNLGVAIGWFAAVLAIELTFRAGTAPMAKGAEVGLRGRLFALGGFAAAVLIWTVPGALFWLSERTVCQVAAAGYFGGHLLYLQAHQGRSPATALTALPSAVAPLLFPILFPHFRGLDQALVITIMAAISGHAIISAAASMVSAKRLAEARVEAEAANRAKTAFLATMSHEIRTPLNGVLGMAQVMANDELTEPQRQRLEVVKQSGESLLAILNDLLDLSKIEAGKLDFETIEFDLEEIVRGAYATFTANANAKGLRFGLDIENARGHYLGDPTRLRQVLYNLISNAVKFTERGVVSVRAAYAEGELVIAVTDSGIGMTDAVRQSLFQSFSQADASTTRRFGGTGLGLSICKQLAELMGGSIVVESAVGQGSTFRFSVPLPRVGDGSAEIAAEAGPADQRQPIALRVLAAEDNDINQLVLKTLLHQVGVEPVVVENGKAAIEAWAAGDWDLILMDMQMPVVDGVAAAREIRRQEAATGRARTPIVALTANAMNHQVARYLAAGMDGHVAKPINAAELYAALDGALAQAAAA
jgi:signal transduction histidine kinase/ActR/RegA family two-component response regulator